jgi:LPPG:FO 2-phospho-L-lactate transferase
MGRQRYLAITGGVGGAKLGLGLSKILAGDELAFVVNTGDDFQHLGLHISPDIDTLIYTLAGQSNTTTGWGRKGETWQFMSVLAELGGETWFKLGDKDLAIHVERTRKLGEGQSLTELTVELASAFGITHAVLPMSDDAVRTVIQTRDGDLDFQHYFVRDQCEPAVTGFEFHGAESSRPSPAVTDWLESDDLGGVILCPSNPFVSIDPILSVPGIREALQRCAAPVIAVSPVVGGAAIKGPTVKMMQELKLPNTATWVAEHYGDFLQGFVVDSADAADKSVVEAMGIECEVTKTVMTSLGDRVELAQSCLEFVSRLSQSPSSTS